MSYELSGPAFRPRRVGGVRRPLHIARHYQVDRRRFTHQQLEGLGFSLKPPKKLRKFVRRVVTPPKPVRKFVSKYGKRIVIGAALAIAAPFVLPAGAALLSSGAAKAGALFQAGLKLLKKAPVPTLDMSTGTLAPFQPDQGTPSMDAQAPMSSAGGGGDGGFPGVSPEPSEDDTTAAPTPTAAGGAGLAIGALLVGGLLLASRSSKRS